MELYSSKNDTEPAKGKFKNYILILDNVPMTYIILKTN